MAPLDQVKEVSPRYERERRRLGRALADLKIYQE
jgi:hypothetical protein